MKVDINPVILAANSIKRKNNQDTHYVPKTNKINFLGKLVRKYCEITLKINVRGFEKIYYIPTKTDPLTQSIKRQIYRIFRLLLHMLPVILAKLINIPLKMIYLLIVIPVELFKPSFIRSGYLEFIRKFYYSSFFEFKKILQEVTDKYEDTTTIFYDAFIDYSNTKLILIGPPMLNLEDILLPMTLAFNQQILSYSITPKRPNVLIIQAKIAEWLQDKNQVHITFNNGQEWEADLPRNTFQSNAKLTLSTLQKDNKFRWIEDWSNYYRINYGVSRIILYDNNSSYQSRLEQKFPDIIIVPWNFKYDLPNTYCQRGSLNHCLYKFGNRGFCMNFDIDELLKIEKTKLEELLQKYSIVYFMPCWIPHTIENKEEYSFSDFKYREKYAINSSYKYIYRFESQSSLAVHGIPNNKKYYYVPVEEGYFYHYAGITTNWKYDRTKISSTEGLIQIED